MIFGISTALLIDNKYPNVNVFLINLGISILQSVFGLVPDV